jgi:cytochrome P450
MKHISAEIGRILRGIITKRENALKSGEARSDDLLGLLLESSIADCRGDGCSNAGMTTDDVIGECKMFYFAGAETTSVLLTWTMIVLSMHPEWQDRAREEVMRVFGTSTPDYDGLSHLKTVSPSTIFVLPYHSGSWTIWSGKRNS